MSTEILAILVLLGFLVSFAGIIYPFKPFRKRRRAALAAFVCFIGAGLLGGEPQTGHMTADRAAESAAGTAKADATTARQSGPTSEAKTKAVAPKPKKAEEPWQMDFDDKVAQLFWINLSRDNLRKHLKDPGSAKFRNAVFVAYRDSTPIVCDEVNARNSLGGYGGFTRYIASSGQLVFFEADMAAGEFARTWNKICVRR